MKFLVDAQLPKRLADHLREHGFDAVHTLDLPAKNATSDSDIIDRSLKEDRIVITKDTDFLETHILKKEPKKLILLRTGNIHNNELIGLIIDHLNFITENIGTSTLLEIDRKRIVVH